MDTLTIPEPCYIPACGKADGHDGPHLKVEPTDQWVLADAGRRCRYQAGRSPACGKPAVVESRRGAQWWPYCRAHSYRRVPLGTRVAFVWHTG